MVGIFFALTIGSLTYLGMLLGLNPLYWASLAIAVVGWVVQYIQLSQPTQEADLYGQIFGQNVLMGFILLAGMILGWL